MTNPTGSFSDQFKYFRSLGQELDSKKDRVRDLIGDAHWLSDGTHKEFLLRDLLQRHSPDGIAIERGFFVDHSHNPACTTEQDILLADSLRNGSLFNESGMLIISPYAALGSISVKTTLNKKELTSAVDGLRSVRQMVSKAHTDPAGVLLAAVFFNAGPPVTRSPLVVYDWYSGAVAKLERSAALPWKPNIISPGPDIIVCLPNLVYCVKPTNDGAVNSHRLCGYKTDGLAAAVLLARIIDHIGTARSGRDTLFSDQLDDPRIVPLSVPERLITVHA